MTELSTEGSQDLLELAVSTGAPSITVSQEEGAAHVSATVEDWAPEYPEAFEILEEWRSSDTPRDLDSVNGHIITGTDEDPAESSEHTPPGEQHGPISVSGPLEEDLTVAGDLLEAAQQHPDVDGVREFRIDLRPERPTVVLSVHDSELAQVPTDEIEVPDELRAAGEDYAAEVEELLGPEAEVEVHLFSPATLSLYPAEA